ncbi:cholesterol 24-hydroxylase-like isoform X1 [Lytechinus variegatus]|uniref:cholesterol 24-hydroxylase-like isoform X1 n=1 Tax=Lytechinus variegatus TaxID=7654 RepID=UPI001BB0DC78|nr:cholesterol 24-hydroxylase-like isoform X1 [Lytechinus variegatus]
MVVTFCFAIFDSSITGISQDRTYIGEKMAANLIFVSCSVLALAFWVAFLGLSLYIAYSRKRYSHIPHPEPLYFFSGNLQLLKDVGDGETWCTVLSDWSKKLGPVYCLHTYTSTVIICEDSSVFKELLSKSKYLKAPDMYRAFRFLYGARAFGNGLLCETNHEAWMKKRAIFNHAFHRRYLMGLMNEFNICGDKLVNHLIPSSDGRTEVAMSEEFARVTMEIIARVGFGMDDDIIGNPDSPLCQLFPKILHGMQSVYNAPLLKYSILPKDIKYRREVREAMKDLREMARRCIQARMDALNQGDEVPQNILTYILQESNNLKGIENFDIEDMIDQFLTFFAAGEDTTSNLLSFTFLHLGRNPEIMKKLRDEVDAILKGKDYVEYSDITQMQYLTLVLKESLRITPPGSMLNRILPHEMDLCGYKVPKDTIVLLPIYGIGRNEKYFKNPDTFDPERFTRDEDSPLFAYVPFSMGSRSCIGQTFAMMEAKVIMCKLIKQLEFQLVPNQNFKFTETITLKPKDGCRNYITKRKL